MRQTTVTCGTSSISRDSRGTNSPQNRRTKVERESRESLTKSLTQRRRETLSRRLSEEERRRKPWQNDARKTTTTMTTTRRTRQPQRQMQGCCAHSHRELPSAGMTTDSGEEKQRRNRREQPSVETSPKHYWHACSSKVAASPSTSRAATGVSSAMYLYYIQRCFTIKSVVVVAVTSVRRH